jgi:Ca2+-binding RTX toxin-like protein
LVVAFLIGCAVLLMADASRVLAETTKKEQGSSPKATASEEARCQGTQKTNVNLPVRFTTNDLPGCPKGGPLLGTDKGDLLAGEKGDDEVRGLGGSDDIMGGDGNDVLYGGSQRDFVGGYDGDDVIYGGPGDDTELDVASAGEFGNDGQRDKLYCGEGRDTYYAE